MTDTDDLYFLIKSQLQVSDQGRIKSYKNPKHLEDYGAP